LKVTFNPAARAELAEAVAFYDEQAAGLGDAFAAEVRRTVLRILEHPDAGYAVRARVRRRLVLRFPYSILYSADEGRLRVLAVMHHRRDPASWEGRV
jgi:plasmid stabilization system protein ParE